MILRLELPQIEAAINSATVATWHTQSGDEIGFGDPVCDLAVSEVTRLVRPQSALKLAPGFLQRARRTTFTLSDLLVIYRLTASEGAFVQELLVAEGDTVSVGNALALVTTIADEELVDPLPEPIPSMRVVANPVPPGELT